MPGSPSPDHDSEVEIRLVRPEDRAGLSDFYALCIPHTFAANAIPPAYESGVEIRAKDRLLDRYYSRNLSAGMEIELYLAISHEILGSFAIRPQNDWVREALAGSHEELPELGAFYVSPRYQGRGLGRAMLSFALARLNQRGYSRFVLDCGYPIAQEFWTRHFGRPAVIQKDRFAPGYSYMIWVVDLGV